MGLLFPGYATAIALSDWYASLACGVSGADVVVMVVDASAGWTQEDGEIFNALWGNGPGSSTCRVKGLGLLVANKADLPGACCVSLPTTPVHYGMTS